MVFPDPSPVVVGVRNSDFRHHPCSYIDWAQVVGLRDHIRTVEVVVHGDKEEYIRLVRVGEVESMPLGDYDRRRESERE